MILNLDIIEFVKNRVYQKYRNKHSWTSVQNRSRPDAHLTLCHKIHVYCVHHQMFAKFSSSVKRKHLYLKWYLRKHILTSTFFLCLVYLISCTWADLLLWHKKLSLGIWLLESNIKYSASNTWPNKCSNECQVLSHYFGFTTLSSK